MFQRVDFDNPSISHTFPFPVELANEVTFVPVPALHRPMADTPCVKSLMAALHARDAALLEHCSKAGQRAFELALAAGLPLAQCQIIWTAGLLHDVGKIVLPDSILLGCAPLTVAERRTMEAHVEVGYQLLKSIPELRKAADIAVHHHERWDGTGYPRSLKGLEIPIGARILAVADAFDAMTSDRTYRPRKTVLTACQVLQSDAGTHFDPDLVRMFIARLMTQSGSFPNSERTSTTQTPDTPTYAGPAPQRVRLLSTDPARCLARQA